MSEDKDEYRPKSPDLSEFVPRQPSLPRLPTLHHSDSSFPPGYAFSPRGSYDASPYFSPQTTQGSYFAPQSYSQQPQYTSPKTSRTPSVPVIPQHQFSSPRQTDQTRYQSYPPPPPPAFNTPTYSQPPYQTSDLNFVQTPTTFDEMARTRGKRVATYNEDEGSDQEFDPVQAPPSVMPTAAAPRPLPENVELSIDVKTKFPVARIKRIMQADEDVGKVAQATPTAVAKALELFMITLVTKAASEANNKRITAQHLKTAVLADDKFDFLAEACANIPDESAKKGRAKSEAKSEDSDEDMGGTVARKKSKT